MNDDFELTRFEKIWFPIERFFKIIYWETHARFERVFFSYNGLNFLKSEVQVNYWILGGIQQRTGILYGLRSVFLIIIFKV